MPKVLLIYPPNQLNPTEAPRPDGSLGPLYLASALENAGIETDLLDATVGTPDMPLEETFFRLVELPNGLIRIGMSQQKIAEFIAGGNYDVVGIHNNFTPQTNMVLETARIAKEVNPNVLAIIGGVSARSMSERILRTGLIDLVCNTEGERIIVKIVRQWRLRRSFDGVDGIDYLDSGNFVRRMPDASSFFIGLDELPIPAWRKLPLIRYASIVSPHGDVVLDGEHLYASMMTSRGCPFRCSYCHISLEKERGEGIGDLRLKSVDRVMEEVEVLRSLGVEKIYIEDESLLAKKARVKEIFQRIRGTGLKIADVNGVNLAHFFVRFGNGGKLIVDREYLEFLHGSGFSQMSFPVESGSQRVLNKYASGKIKLEAMDVVELVRVASEIGISCPIGIMIGFPDETEREMMQSVELGRRLVDEGAKYCAFYLPVPFPGSKLYEIAVKGGYLGEDFDPDFMNWHRSVMVNTAVPPEKILELKNWAWRTVNRPDYVSERVARNIASGLKH